MVTINPAAHYNLNCGCIREGYMADFIIVDDLVNFNVSKTYIGGE
jgi:adenine deaminase